MRGMRTNFRLLACLDKAAYCHDMAPILEPDQCRSVRLLAWDVRDTIDEVASLTASGHTAAAREAARALAADIL